MAPIVWPKDPKGQLKILKKFFRGKTKIPATCTTKDGNLTVLRQDKKSKIGVSKQKKCPKTRSTPKTPKESTKTKRAHQSNVSFSPSPVSNKKYRFQNFTSDDDDPKNPVYDLLMKSAPGSKNKKNKKKKGKSNIK